MIAGRSSQHELCSAGPKVADAIQSPRGDDGLRDITKGMAFGRPGLLVTLVFACLSAVFATSAAAQPWLRSAEIVVPRTSRTRIAARVCASTTKTPISRGGREHLLVHRTAGENQCWDPTVRLRVYRWKKTPGRDSPASKPSFRRLPTATSGIRPFTRVGNRLYIKSHHAAPRASRYKTGRRFDLRSRRPRPTPDLGRRSARSAPSAGVFGGS